MHKETPIIRMCDNVSFDLQLEFGYQIKCHHAMPQLVRVQITDSDTKEFQSKFRYFLLHMVVTDEPM